MKRLAFLLAIALSLFSKSGRAAKPQVSRASIEARERNLNTQLSGLWPEDPYLVLGPTRGIYLDGYGAVFTAEIDLVPGPGISPFHPMMTKQNITDNHQKMLQRLPKLKEAMTGLLASAAEQLDNVPPEERVVLGITLTRYSWQDRTGIPAQLVMGGTKGRLIAAKRAGQLPAAITVEEY